MNSFLKIFLITSTIFFWSWLVAKIVEWNSNRAWEQMREDQKRAISQDTHRAVAKETLERVRVLEVDLAKLTTLFKNQGKGKKS